MVHVPFLLLAVVLVVHCGIQLSHLPNDRVQCVLAVLGLYINLADALKNGRNRKHGDRAGHGGTDHPDAHLAGAVAIRLPLGEHRIPHASPDRKHIDQHGDKAQGHGIAYGQRAVQALHAQGDNWQHLNHRHIRGFR